MKLNSIFLLLFFSATFCFGQNDITFKFDGDKKNLSLEGEKHLKRKQDNKITIHNVNKAIYSLKVDAKDLELYTPIPELLKPLFPSLGSSVIFGSKNTLVADPEFDILKTKLINIRTGLNSLKSNSDKLYKSTLIAPNHQYAKDVFDIVLSDWNNVKIEIGSAESPKNEDELETKVSYAIAMLISSRDILKGTIENGEPITTNFVDLYTIASANAAVVEKDNYMRYLNFINASKTADNKLESKYFKSYKDLVDARIILVDTYKKDTVYNAVTTLYTSGGWGLGFSTGFFYTRKLSDPSYYLEKQTDGTMRVLEDERMKNDLAIGGLAHLYYKFCPAFRFGPALGLAISPFDGKTRYLLGLSGLIGKEKLIGISIGAAMAKRKELSSLASQVDGFNVLPIGTTAVPTYDKMDYSFFVGVSYNLFATKK